MAHSGFIDSDASNIFFVRRAIAFGYWKAKSRPVARAALVPPVETIALHLCRLSDIPMMGVGV